MSDKKLRASAEPEAFFSASKSLSPAFIHPTAVVEDSVELEEGVFVGPFCHLTGHVKIGAGTILHAHVSIGAPAQVIGLYTSLGSVIIGRECQIREFVSIHASRFEHGTTVIGDHCYIMSYAHVAHDVTIGNHVVLTNGSSLGGHTIIEDHVRIMAHAATHQFCRVGTFAALAPYSGIRQDLPPFSLFSGQPAEFAGLNKVGLARNNFSPETIERIKKVTRMIYQQKLPIQTIQQMIREHEELHNDTHINYLVSFVETSLSTGRGISRRMLHHTKST